MIVFLGILATKKEIWTHAIKHWFPSYRGVPGDGGGGRGVWVVGSP